MVPVIPVASLLSFKFSFIFWKTSDLYKIYRESIMENVEKNNLNEKKRLFSQFAFSPWVIRLHFDKGLDKQVAHLIGTVEDGRNHNPENLKFEQMISR